MASASASAAKYSVNAEYRIALNDPAGKASRSEIGNHVFWDAKLVNFC